MTYLLLPLVPNEKGSAQEEEVERSFSQCLNTWQTKMAKLYKKRSFIAIYPSDVSHNNTEIALIILQ